MMTTAISGFPVYLQFGSLRVHPHLFFESLAYIAAFRVYLWVRRRNGDALPDVNRWWVIAAARGTVKVGPRRRFNEGFTEF
jgi:hypothetical protein